MKKAQLSVKGTSTLHDWESKASKVYAKGEIVEDAGVLTGVKHMKVSVDAKSIVSTKGKMMDEKTWEALKADKHPKITYELVSVASIAKQATGYTIKTNGNLTIAGVTKSIPMTVQAQTLEDGSLEFTGSKEILLSDYGMTPPTALMNTVKVGKTVTVSFKVSLQKSQPGQ